MRFVGWVSLIATGVGLDTKLFILVSIAIILSSVSLGNFLFYLRVSLVHDSSAAGMWHSRRDCPACCSAVPNATREECILAGRRRAREKVHGLALWDDEYNGSGPPPGSEHLNLDKELMAHRVPGPRHLSRRGSPASLVTSGEPDPAHLQALRYWKSAPPIFTPLGRGALCINLVRASAVGLFLRRRWG